MDVNRSGEMEVFARVAEAKSFSAAARRLRLTPSAVAKLVSRLEDRLGARLVNRSTRSLTLTAEGEAFYERATGILADIDEAESGVGGGASVPSGRLRVNTSVPFGTHVLLPIVPEFLASHPRVSLDLAMTDDVIDILAERTDVAIRIGPLKDSQLTARKLGVSRRLVVAAPSYLARQGQPQAPDDLAQHNCLNFNFRRSFYEWVFAAGGERRTVPIAGNVLANNGETLRLLTLAGLGLSRLACFHVAEDLRAGRLVPVLDGYDAGEIEEIHAVFLGRGYMPARVRAFVDFLVEHVAID